MSVKTLELKSGHVEMEIENLKITHRMEKDMLQKNHEYVLLSIYIF